MLCALNIYKQVSNDDEDGYLFITSQEENVDLIQQQRISYNNKKRIKFTGWPKNFVLFSIKVSQKNLFCIQKWPILT